jgi:hypothetical protein
MHKGIRRSNGRREGPQARGRIPAAACRASMRCQQACLRSSGMTLHSRISSIERQQPSHKPLVADIRHTPMQGEGQSPPLRRRVWARDRNTGTGGRTGMSPLYPRAAFPTPAPVYAEAKAGRLPPHQPFNARLASRARATREPLGRPRCPLMNAPASTKAARSMPVSMPSPCNKKTTSSVATLPVAPWA